MILESKTLYDSMAPCGCLHAFKNQNTDFIKEFAYWFLALNWEQGFLGRSILFLKAHKVDEVELTDQEATEKHAIYCLWRRAISRAFAPDKINQAQLGNEEFLHHGHLHWHFVPRYRRPMTFADTSFQNDDSETQKVIYSDIHKRTIYPVEVREKIKKKLLEHF